jgi:hypothetical protein
MPLETNALDLVKTAPPSTAEPDLTLMHVAQKCAAVLGRRLASKQDACRPEVRSRFWNDDLHRNKDLKARCLNSFQRDAL